MLNPDRQAIRFDNAFQDLTTGDFQEWQAGLQFSMTLGFRQAHAAMRGRAYVLPDDVKAQATAVLRHRLFLNADAQMRGRTTTAIVAEVLARTTVPAEDVAATAG